MSMKHSQAKILESNRSVGEELREDKSAWGEFHEATSDYFLKYQQRRILQIRHKHEDAMDSVESVIREKRASARALREELRTGYQKELAEKEAHAEYGRDNAMQQKAAREQAVVDRYLSKYEQVSKHNELGKQGRDERRTAHGKIVEEMRQEASAQATKVRHETRPSVRQEGRVYFQEQRDALYAASKEEHARNKEAIAAARARHLERQAVKRAETHALHEQSLEARQSLLKSKQREAKEVKERRQVAVAHGKKEEEEARQQRKVMHDTIAKHQKDETTIFNWWYGGSSE